MHEINITFAIPRILITDERFKLAQDKNVILVDTEEKLELLQKALFVAWEQMLTNHQTKKEAAL